MSNKQELIFNFLTYNSLHNLEKIFDEIFKSNLKINKIFITDNNSQIEESKKLN